MNIFEILKNHKFFPLSSECYNISITIECRMEIFEL